MTKTDILGRLLELVIPGGEKQKIPIPNRPCFECAKCSNSFVTPCKKYMSFIVEYNKNINEWFPAHWKTLIAAIKKYNVIHCHDEHNIYIPRTQSVLKILTMLQNRKWKETISFIVPLLYKRSTTTWESILVALAMRET